jgi:methylenetetrahydrofolate--tRNA-(uracil-5-)-methyltransferase
MAERGRETLAHGPLKPVGLIDPRTGRQAFATVQLRLEDRFETLFNLVGFQTRLKHEEQKRVFRMIPGLEGAEFVRWGSIHRNTFIDSPRLLNESLQLKTHPELFFAGQITGVEGYMESTAMGLLSGINALRYARGIPTLVPPPTTAMGALVHYITSSATDPFQPMNINFGLFTPLESTSIYARDVKDRKHQLPVEGVKTMPFLTRFTPLLRKSRGRERRLLLAKRAMEEIVEWKIRNES